MAKRRPAAGAYMIMIESGGITEDARQRQTDVAARFIRELGIEKVMMGGRRPCCLRPVHKAIWPDVNLFVDHSRIVQLECLISGI